MTLPMIPTKTNASQTALLRHLLLSILALLLMVAPPRNDQGRRSADAPHQKNLRPMIVMTMRRRHDATPNKHAFDASTSPAVY